MLFHTYWDLYCQVSSFVFDWKEGCSVTFVRSNLWIKLWKNLSLYQIKTSYHGKCLNDFYSCDALKKLTRSFFLMHRNSWIKIIRAHFPWNNLYFHNNEIHQWLHFPCQQEGILSALVNLSDTESNTSREMISRCVSSLSRLRFLSSLMEVKWLNNYPMWAVTRILTIV